MSNTRRNFLRASMATGSVAIALSAGLLSPRTVMAAWPKAAFSAKTMDDAMKAYIGTTNPTESNQLSVDAPDIAENGAVVSITVKSTIPNAESITLLVPENANPLTASYLVTSQIEDFITSRIKMRKTSDVVAVVKAGGKVYSAKKPVKVTLGGCGG